MNQGKLAGALVCAAALTLTSTALGEPATGKPILIGAHLDQAKQASYYSLLQKDSIDLFVKELKQASPKNQVVVLKYFESFAP